VAVVAETQVILLAEQVAAEQDSEHQVQMGLVQAAQAAHQILAVVQVVQMVDQAKAVQAL
jgi:hypothetical protein